MGVLISFKPKTRFKNLVRLGVDKINAAKITANSKGYYRLSKTYAVNRHWITVTS